MKITVLMGSPYIDGNCDKMVRAFTKGAEEAGHEVVRFNVADMIKRHYRILDQSDM